jgi:hypothetical protein
MHVSTAEICLQDIKIYYRSKYLLVSRKENNTKQIKSINVFWKHIEMSYLENAYALLIFVKFIKIPMQFYIQLVVYVYMFPTLPSR